MTNEQKEREAFVKALQTMPTQHIQSMDGTKYYPQEVLLHVWQAARTHESKAVGLDEAVTMVDDVLGDDIVHEEWNGSRNGGTFKTYANNNPETAKRVIKALEAAGYIKLGE